jgi:hypothetical protein
MAAKEELKVLPRMKQFVVGKRRCIREKDLFCDVLTGFNFGS